MANILVDRERALKLLGAGLSNEIVAHTLGCESSYISQLMGDDSFRDAVAALRTATLTAATARDQKADDVEDTLLDKIGKAVEYLVRPTDLLRAYQVMNAAKRRGVPAHESTIINNQIVNLVLPTQITERFVKNGMNEVVEVDERALITISSTTLLRDVALEHPDERKRNELEKLAKSLPSSIREQLAVRDSVEDGRMPSTRDYQQAGIVREA